MELRSYRTKSLAEAFKLVRLEYCEEETIGTQKPTEPPALTKWHRSQDEPSNHDSNPSTTPTAWDGGIDLTADGVSISDNDLFGETAQIRPSSVNRPATRQPSSPPAATMSELDHQVLSELSTLDCDAKTASELLAAIKQQYSPSEWNGSPQWQARLVRIIQEHIATTGPFRLRPGEPTVVAVVGATGVGKTTLAAKLAAHYLLESNKTVGLISVDHYRLAASDQLKAYANILGIPMEVGQTTHDVKTAIHKLSDRDLILIDTAGRSPNHEMHMRELQSLIEAVPVDHVQLVLSVVESGTNLARTVHKFRHIQPHSIAFTKLDEAAALGQLVPLFQAGIPVSYVSTGQSVPEDIHVAKPIDLAQAILGRHPWNQ
ncbi:MAG: GTPase [Pirellulaceae bacterium]